jgi:hypothetical protein
MNGRGAGLDATSCSSEDGTGQAPSRAQGALFDERCLRGLRQGSVEALDGDWPAAIARKRCRRPLSRGALVPSQMFIEHGQAWPR